MMRTLCWNLWSEKRSLSSSPLTFFSSPVFWFSANHHVLHHSYAYPFALLSYLTWSRVPLPFYTLFSPSYSLGVLLFYICILEVSTSFTLFYSLSFSSPSPKQAHAQRVNETLMENRLCLFCSQSLILALQSKAQIRSRASKAQSSVLPEHCVKIKKKQRVGYFNVFFGHFSLKRWLDIPFHVKFELAETCLYQLVTSNGPKNQNKKYKCLSLLPLKNSADKLNDAGKWNLWRVVWERKVPGQSGEVLWFPESFPNIRPNIKHENCAIIYSPSGSKFVWFSSIKH